MLVAGRCRTRTSNFARLADNEIRIAMSNYLPRELSRAKVRLRHSSHLCRVLSVSRSFLVFLRYHPAPAKTEASVGLFVSCHSITTVIVNSLMIRGPEVRQSELSMCLLDKRPQNGYAPYTRKVLIRMLVSKCILRSASKFLQYLQIALIVPQT